MPKFTLPVVVEAPTEADAVRVLGEYLNQQSVEPTNEAGDYIEHSIWSWGEA